MFGVNDDDQVHHEHGEGDYESGGYLPYYLVTWQVFFIRSFLLSFIRKFLKNIRFWLGGAAPQTPRFLAGGAKPPQTLPLNGRSSHLIEAAKRGRLDQMTFVCSALLTTWEPPTTSRRPSAGRPTTVHGTNDSTVPSFSA